MYSIFGQIWRFLQSFQMGLHLFVQFYQLSFNVIGVAHKSFQQSVILRENSPLIRHFCRGRRRGLQQQRGRSAALGLNAGPGAVSTCRAKMPV